MLIVACKNVIVSGRYRVKPGKHNLSSNTRKSFATSYLINCNALLPVSKQTLLRCAYGSACRLTIKVSAQPAK